MAASKALADIFLTTAPEIVAEWSTLPAVGLLSAIRGVSEPAPEVGSPVVEKLVLELAALSDNEELFLERIAELELAIEDRDWTRVGVNSDGFQFNREYLDQIVHVSRLYALKNPVIKRPVELQAYYVWAQGVSIHAEGRLNEVVQGFLKDPANRISFTGHDAMMDMERRQRVEGNLFLRFFTTPSSGRLRVRKLPLDEMRSIVYNPDDHDEPWFYVRHIPARGGRQARKVAYPDWRYARQRKVEKADGAGDERIFSMPSLTLDEMPEDVVIEWETPVMHRKSGCFGDMDFGIPETYAAIDWARAYKESLEDYKKTIRSLATWAWKLKTGGGQSQLEAAAAMLNTTFGNSDATTETNPVPPKGSLFAYSGDMDMRAVDVSKAVIDPEGFRRILLMAATSMGMPEIYYGAAEGNFATAKSMDRPTELQFLDRQTMWAEVFTDVITLAIEAAAEAPKNNLVRSRGYDASNGLMMLTVDGEPADVEVEVEFPPILQKDIQSWMQALVSFVTMNGQAMQAMQDGPTLYRMALTALGVDDVEKIIELFYPKDGSEPTNQEIKTYEAPKSPEEVELEKQENAKKELEAIAAQQRALAMGPNGNQPENQGAAGAGNNGKQSRGGPNAVARESLDAESEARIDFMNALIEMKKERADADDHQAP